MTTQITDTLRAIEVANVAWMRASNRTERVALMHYVMVLQFKLTLLGV